ncbi:MAG: hypothetical protein RLZZ385_1289 [Pseudomonadota bacterium]|jgi:polyisoprenoid-binding protein YceI
MAPSRFFRVLLILTPLLLASTAHGQWALDNDASTLSFVTTKAEHVAEVHTFDRLNGTLGADGALSITIELASVNTLIEIRDERMRTLLFDTGVFPQARITGQVDMAAVNALSTGAGTRLKVDFTLDLHGQSAPLSAEVMVVKLADGLLATTVKPVIVNAGNFALVAGVEALREVAGLPSISNSVPVSFTVAFDSQ